MATTVPAEFCMQRSHARRYWWIIIMMIVGSVGNAGLAAVVPVLTGDAFNTMLKPTPDPSALIPLALIIGITQVIRGALQLGRNFGAELLAQKLERSIRDELYLSLLGKSMTFHNLQPIGDTMLCPFCHLTRIVFSTNLCHCHDCQYGFQSIPQPFGLALVT
jgi:ABC-type multidrug transport system fused ATPase/permease subunit